MACGGCYTTAFGEGPKRDDNEADNRVVWSEDTERRGDGENNEPGGGSSSVPV